MTLHLDIPPEMEKRLQEHAQKSGKRMSEIVLEAIESRLDSTSQRDPDTQVAAWRRFLTRAEAHAKTLPQGHFVDDSRESIYQGRGE